MTIGLEMKTYKTVVRPVMLHVSELWAFMKAEKQMIERKEMRMLRWMLGASSTSRITNSWLLI